MTNGTPTNTTAPAEREPVRPALVDLDHLPERREASDELPDLVPGARRIPREIWLLAAEHLGRGYSLEATARGLGVSRMTLWRARQSSPAFVERIEIERRLHLDSMRNRLTRMSENVVGALNDLIARRNVRTVLWAADRLLPGRNFLETPAPLDRPALPPAAEQSAVTMTQVPGSTPLPLFIRAEDAEDA